MTITIRRILGVACAWGILWLAFWTILGMIIGAVDPDSIDPGEPAGMLAVLGPMGFLSGVAFGSLLAIGARGTAVKPSLTRAGGLGILGTAIVQLAYLGHGDQGLLANLQMALLFSVIGGLVTVVWFVVTRTWSRWRLSQGPHPDAA